MRKSAEVLADARHVLLDFDGPVCAVFGGTSDHEVADQLRAVLGNEQLPADVASSSDPFAVLRFAATVGRQRAAQVEQQLARLEMHAVASAPPTIGAREAIAALHEAGRTVTIVSNNSAQAIVAYLQAHDLAPLITGVVGRADPAPELLKPSPHLVQQAIHARRAQPVECVLIGDSTTDIEAAQAANATVIAYANKPGKRRRFAAQHPDAIIHSMAELAVDAGRLDVSSSIT